MKVFVDEHGDFVLGEEHPCQRYTGDAGEEARERRRAERKRERKARDGQQAGEEGGGKWTEG